MTQEHNCCRGADVAFGESPEEAFRQFRNYHDDDADAEDMAFYELGKMQTATVTWTLS
jgi:hypothetical protein